MLEYKRIVEKPYFNDVCPFRDCIRNLGILLQLKNYEKLRIVKIKKKEEKKDKKKRKEKRSLRKKNMMIFFH